MLINRVFSWVGYKVVRAFPGEVSARSHLKEFVNRRGDLFQGKILDVGSGTWTMLKDTYPNVTTFDIAAPADVVGDAHYLSRYFTPASFDTVCALELLEHVVEPAKVLSEILKVLKPNGIFIGATPFMYALHGEEYGDYWRFTRQGWNLLLKDFKDVQITWNGNEFAPSHYIVIARK